MESAHRWLLIAGLLLIASIVGSRLSTRIGAPLLLAFLGLGMLAGEEGLLGVSFGESAAGGIRSSDLEIAYFIGSAALSLILLDGGIRTERASFRLAFGPALMLATIGVAITAGITGLVAAPLLDLDLGEGLLVGAVLASTDAAAVFLLLHQRGGRTSARLNATLEVESGINDPVAVFLTTTLVGFLAATQPAGPGEIALTLLREMTIGAAMGLAGGWLVLRLANTLELAAGLYPLLVLAGGIAIFAAAMLAHGSGYLAVYLAGVVLGNAHLRGSRVIGRFLDGMAWLAQIVLFVMLGLFVSPRSLAVDAVPALGVAAVLILVARPVAVWLCLAPFRFTPQERVFIAWVGLRGAVPIFLAMLPLIAGLPGSEAIFNVAFIVVLASLALQGWTVGPLLRRLGLEMPEETDPTERLDFDLPAGHGREVAVYRVAERAAALDHEFGALPLPQRSRILAVLRDGVVQSREGLERLQPHDLVFAVVPLEEFERLDRLFGAPRRRGRNAGDPLGDFALDPAATVGEIADLYGLPAAVEHRATPLATFMSERLGRRPDTGDHVHLGGVDLVVRAVRAGRIAEIGMVLEPRISRLERLSLRRLPRVVARRLRRIR